MKKAIVALLLSTTMLCAGLVSMATASDINLAKTSTLEQILKRGEIRIGFDVGYVPL